MNGLRLAGFCINVVHKYGRYILGSNARDSLIHFALYICELFLMLPNHCYHLHRPTNILMYDSIMF